MAVSHALASLGRLIWRTPSPPVDALEAYAHEVVPVLDRAEWLYQYWLEQSSLFTGSEKLGNVAAIHGWETAKMGRSLERVVPPAVLARPHEAVIDALDLASRAAHLLSKGSRFHNASAVCEGQAMLVASRERRLAALRSMRRYLLLVPPAQPADIPIGAAAGEESGSEDAESVPSGEGSIAAALDGHDTHLDTQIQGLDLDDLGSLVVDPNDPDAAHGLPSHLANGPDYAPVEAPAAPVIQQAPPPPVAPAPTPSVAAASARPMPPTPSQPARTPAPTPAQPPTRSAAPAPVRAETAETPPRSGWGALFGRSGGSGADE